jgi:ATP-dependent Clp protease adaptor protein ClpS
MLTPLLSDQDRGNLWTGVRGIADRLYSGGVSIAPVELERPDSLEAVAPDLPWITIVWNDPVNLMSYVTYVFESYFGYPRSKAEKLMLDVHKKGRAVVSNGTREEMEKDTEAMHEYGLWATFQKDT